MNMEIEDRLREAIKTKDFALAHQLLDEGADPRKYDTNNLTAVDYAQLSGDITFFKEITEITRRKNVENVTRNFKEICNKFRDLPDFKVDFHWRVYSWMPFITSFCPSDHWTILKVGDKFRVNTTIANWSGFRWTRGSVSIYFDASSPDMLDSIVCVDNVNGDRVSVLREVVENPDIEQDISTLMIMDLLKGSIQTDSIQIKQSTGFFGRKKRAKLIDRTWESTPFDLNNARVDFIHYYCDDFGKENPREYHHTKVYSGRFWCSEDFPVQPEMLVPFFEMLAPFKETPKNIMMLLGLFNHGMPVFGEVYVFPTVRFEFQFLNYDGNVDNFRNDVNIPPPSQVQ